MKLIELKGKEIPNTYEKGFQKHRQPLLLRLRLTVAQQHETVEQLKSFELQRRNLIVRICIFMVRLLQTNRDHTAKFAQCAAPTILANRKLLRIF